MAPKRYQPPKAGIISTSSKTSDKEELLKARALKRTERVKARCEEAEKHKEVARRIASPSVLCRVNKSHRMLMPQGNALFRKGEYRKAIEEYEAAIKIHGPSPAYLHWMENTLLPLTKFRHIQ
ncbi:hypothetical protein EDB92DRAFT_1955083 [Lactarius akahatsu]|uniref:Tetratricopeptide repeat protein n=1 Tax=Lactarius akahatsu TaxID=416441 RepID=A0AAD4Q2W0_9AGAM|nr:hypothetical protein EDB92DRAFT_1955083 [Lactarius akahatsu]